LASARPPGRMASFDLNIYTQGAEELRESENFSSAYVDYAEACWPGVAEEATLGFLQRFDRFFLDEWQSYGGPWNGFYGTNSLPGLNMKQYLFLLGPILEEWSLDWASGQEEVTVTKAQLKAWMKKTGFWLGNSESKYFELMLELGNVDQEELDELSNDDLDPDETPLWFSSMERNELMEQPLCPDTIDVIDIETFLESTLLMVLQCWLSGITGSDQSTR
jgi:hypothetical protein